MQPDLIISAIRSVTKRWTKQRLQEQRAANSYLRRAQALHRSEKVNLIDAAFQVIEKAYLFASTGGTLPTSATQVMYAARDDIMALTGLDTIDRQYFNQKLLPRFIRENPELTKNWDVTFDGRGHLVEPHTDEEVSLGTLDVRRYLGECNGPCRSPIADIDPTFPTTGPRHRYGAILFVEKEGFGPLFRHTRLAERFDIAIMSTKGMSVTAARLLVDRLCGPDGVPLLVLHDFDKSGLTILQTLQHDTERYTFQNRINAIDIGVRLDDVNKWKLKSEAVTYGKSDPTENLLASGASPEELAELLDPETSYPNYAGKRVELNAFSSGDFIQFIESKLHQHGIRKVIPDTQTISTAFRRAFSTHRLNLAMAKTRRKIDRQAATLPVPDDLTVRIAEMLKQNPETSWDTAVAEMARECVDCKKPGQDEVASPSYREVIE
jgi:hypothetical protein